MPVCAIAGLNVSTRRPRLFSTAMRTAVSREMGISSPADRLPPNRRTARTTRNGNRKGRLRFIHPSSFYGCRSFHRREGDRGDVPRRTLDLRRVVPDVRVQPRDDMPGVPVEKTLPENAEYVTPDFRVERTPAKVLPHEGPKRFVERQDRPVDDPVEGTRRLDDFPRHQFSEPRRPPLVENPQEEDADEPGESSLRRSRPARGIGLGIFLAGLAVGEFQHVGGQIFLALEIIVHRCDVDVGPTADLANGGAAIPLFGEPLPRGIEQPLAGPFG